MNILDDWDKEQSNVYIVNYYLQMKKKEHIQYPLNSKIYHHLENKPEKIYLNHL